MKRKNPSDASLDRTTTAFTILLIAAGFALLLGSYAGMLSLDHIEKFWPVSIVAAGLTRMLTSNEGRQA